MISFLIGILSGCSHTTSTHTIQKDLSKDQIIEINYDDVLKKINQKEGFVLYIGRPDCKDCQEFELYLKKYLNKNKGVYLYYFNIKEYRDQANSQEATKKEKSRCTAVAILLSRILSKFSPKCKKFLKKRGVCIDSDQFVLIHIGSKQSQKAL